MDEFQHFKSEAEANQHQDLLSDGFVRVDNPTESDIIQPKASDTAEEDLYSASSPSEEPAAYSSDLVSFDSSPTIDSNPLIETVSAPADSSSDPEPQHFTEPPHDDSPVADLLGGFNSEPSEPLPVEEPKEVPAPSFVEQVVDVVPAVGCNTSQPLHPVKISEEEMDWNQKLEPEVEENEKPAEPAVEEVTPVDETPMPAASTSPALISTSPSQGALIDLSRLDPRVVELVYWRDPKKSGVAFGSILIVLLAFANFSSISVVAYVLLSILTVTISFRVYKSVMQAVQKTGEGNPFKPYLDQDISISEEQVKVYAAEAVGKINCYVAAIRRYILVEDVVESIKFAVFLWFLTYIGCMFNGLTLVIFAHIALFTLPLVYENNQAQIDDAVGKAYTKVNTIYEQLREKVPFLKKKTE